MTVVSILLIAVACFLVKDKNSITQVAMKKITGVSLALIAMWLLIIGYGSLAGVILFLALVPSVVLAYVLANVIYPNQTQ